MQHRHDNRVGSRQADSDRRLEQEDMMSEHKIGDQWIEVIDGKNHMVKAVKGFCENCCLSHLCNLAADCPMDFGLLGKDLGILNEDGCLPCPFCGEYPEVIRDELFGWESFCDGVGHYAVCRYFKTSKQAIDAWNRRI